MNFRRPFAKILPLAAGCALLLFIAAGTPAYAQDYLPNTTLSWLASPSNSHGTFTLGAGKTFDFDIDLIKRVDGPFGSALSGSYAGWDGGTLTKNGAGTLVVSGMADIYRAVATGGTLQFTGTSVLSNTFNNLAAFEATDGAYASLWKSTISTGGENAYGVYAHNGAIISASSVGITTTGNESAGLWVNDNGNISVKSSTFGVTGELVGASGGGLNTVTLDTVTSTNGSNVITADGSGTANINVLNTKLTGNLTSSSTAISNIYLQNNSNLIGASLRNNTSQLNVNIDVTSKWEVSGNSTLTSVLNGGKVDMKTTGNTLRTMSLNGNFTQQASGLIAMSLSGTGGVPNALVTVAGQTTLAGGLELTGDLSSLVALGGGHFVLFNDLGSSAVSGVFDSITLNGTSLFALNFAELASTNGGGTFVLDGYEYTFTYAGDAATGNATGGNDVLISYVGVAVPEPGIWVMLLGGLGILLASQRLRRCSLSYRIL